MAPQIFLACLFVGVFIGCNRDEVVVYRIPKETTVEKTNITPPSSNQPIQWTLPTGWQESPASGMRLATMKTNSAAEVSVIMLAGTAGGTVANVNRWRDQLGLGAMSPQDLEKQLQKIKTDAGVVSVIDIQKDEDRILSGFIPVQGKSWFFKMTGTVQSVEKARPSFIKLLQSLKLATP